MKVLSEYQKKFLLDYFFENEKYAGWRNIAMDLIETGECIVPGPKCIWIGNIGNFINTEVAKGAVDCLLYKFDLESFLTSELYKGIRNEYVDIIYKKKQQIEQEYKEISNI